MKKFIHVVSDNKPLRGYLAKILEGLGHAHQEFPGIESYTPYMRSKGAFAPLLLLISIKSHQQLNKLLTQLKLNQPNLKVVCIREEAESIPEEICSSFLHLQEPFYPSCIENLIQNSQLKHYEAAHQHYSSLPHNTIERLMSAACCPNCRTQHANPSKAELLIRQGRWLFRDNCANCDEEILSSPLKEYQYQ